MNKQTFTDLEKAATALAEALHQEAVNNHESLDSEWNDRTYRYSMVNEARDMLKKASQAELEAIAFNYNIKYNPTEEE